MKDPNEVVNTVLQTAKEAGVKINKNTEKQIKEKTLPKIREKTTSSELLIRHTTKDYQNYPSIPTEGYIYITGFLTIIFMLIGLGTAGLEQVSFVTFGILLVGLIQLCTIYAIYKDGLQSLKEYEHRYGRAHWRVIKEEEEIIDLTLEKKKRGRPKKKPEQPKKKQQKPAETK